MRVVIKHYLKSAKGDALMSSIINLKNIVVSYDGERVLDGINLSIKDGEFMTLLGPSGCGKTTTLRIIAGFINPEEGEIFFGGEKINDLPPYKRAVNTVFQKYALFPHLNVFDNIAFGLKLNRMPKSQIKSAVTEMLEIVNLSGFENRKVDQLSGGQQQRVAIARALVNHPKVLLLDEPLGALDLKLRKEMQTELMQIQKKLGITFIYVTHDQEEALTMSDTVVVMKDGEIQQIGTPQDIYNEPRNAFVADFIGESNIIDGIMHKDYLVEIAGVEYRCVDKGFKPMQPVDVVIRPEDITIVPKDNAPVRGIVDSVVFKGVHFEITVIDSGGLLWTIHSTKSAELKSEVGLSFGPDDIHIMEKLVTFSTNNVAGVVTDEDTVEFLGVKFERENLGLEKGTEVTLTISPDDIEVASEDISDLVVYLESMVYKGAYNEFIVYVDERELIFHSQNDEEVATDIGIKFNFDNIVIRPLGKADFKGR